jgi:hypothetical protein
MISSSQRAAADSSDGTTKDRRIDHKPDIYGEKEGKK